MFCLIILVVYQQRKATKPWKMETIEEILITLALENKIPFRICILIVIEHGLGCALWLFSSSSSSFLLIKFIAQSNIITWKSTWSFGCTSFDENRYFQLNKRNITKRIPGISLSDTVANVSLPVWLIFNHPIKNYLRHKSNRHFN